MKYTSKPQPISVTLYPEQIARLNLMDINISKFIRKLIDNETLTDEEIGKLIEEYQREIERLQKLKGKEKRGQEIKVDLSGKQVEFLKNAKGIISKDATFREGQLNFYNNEFGEDLDKDEFKKLLSEV